MKIVITKECYCEADMHEMAYYPREGFKAKPRLKVGTVLEVSKEWTNFYGAYFRCETPDGTYDVSICNAKIVDYGTSRE